MQGLIPQSQQQQVNLNMSNQAFPMTQDSGSNSNSGYAHFYTSNPNAPSTHNRFSLVSSNTSNLDQQPLIDDESIQRIITGEEQRTYVMMRNIPNQYTKEKL